MSRPRSESGPILNWSSPGLNSDLGRPKSELRPGLHQFRTQLAKIKILIWAGPNQNPLINNDKMIRDLDLGQTNSDSNLGLDIYI